MNAWSVALYVLFVICGIVTLRVLKKKKQKVARVMYIVLFCVLLAYLPWVMGSRLMLRFLSKFLYTAVVDTMAKHLLTPLVVTMPWFTVSFVVGIVSSVLLCISVIVLAVTVCRRIARKLKKLFVQHAGSTYAVTVRQLEVGIPVRAARYRFCRYNC